MTTDTMPRVQQCDAPASIRAVDTFAEANYVDHFTVTASQAADKTPEEWARVALEGVSPTARFIVWQVLCGLRLESRPSPDHVAGWKIDERGDCWIRLEAASWFMTCHAVVYVEEELVSVALFVRYDQPAAALIWPPISIGHRQAMPGLLCHAVRRMNRGR